MEETVQQIVVLQKRGVYVYHAKPPEKDGYRAASWRDLLCVSPLAVSLSDHDVCITLPDLPAPLTETRIPAGVPLKRCLERAFDSSRAFALRAANSSSGKRTWLGIFFQNREDSLDFEVTLQRYVEEPTECSPASLLLTQPTAQPSPPLSQPSLLLSQPSPLLSPPQEVTAEVLAAASVLLAAQLPPAKPRRRK
eukprot:Gregarina_sp_Pseudo_9__776@NODE_1497_length_1545_cov_44_236388_g1387_i0_p2_GENE_NODE_1497_length_1545_cov_44_236388_g1387_i0NODE_1497_length_1545_cov_44_236388_g1387_i0_p2_ORF_typecomplete_len194_score46_40DUF1681/PF07933_14/4_1e17_NODE_1497_length_1545_cov_44_236388_g1387_i0128709